MSYGIDFGALRPISAFDSAIQGVEAGRAYRKERDTQSAFATYATDPEAGYKAMMAVDPKTGLALRDDAMAQATASRRKQVASLYRENPQAARDAAIAGGDFDLVTEFGKLDDQQRARAKESVELLAGIAAGLKTKPYEQRKPILAAAKPYLLERGLKPEQIDNFDPTDPNLDALTGQVLDLKTQMEMAQPDIRQSGRHVAAIDKRTGEKRWGYDLPADPEFKAFSRDQDVYQTGGDLGSGGAPVRPAQRQSPALSIPAAQSTISEVLGEGVRFTSGLRTPEKNAAVDGAKNSYHLRGQAVDLVPPPGMTTAQAAQRLKASGLPFVELIDEGDHVHVAWREDAQPYETAANGAVPPPPAAPAPAGGAAPSIPGMTLVRRGSQDKEWRVLSPEEGAQYGPGRWKVNSKTGNVEQLSGTANTGKRVPGPIVSAITSNRAAIAKIDAAIAAIEKYPAAMGLANIVGDAVRQRIDPKGVPVRALIADIGSQKIHERSGAAVTLSEAPRLQPFVPNVNDTKDAAIAKLRSLRSEYVSTTADTESFYSPENGYAAPEQPRAAPPPVKKPLPKAAAPAAPQVGQVIKGYRFKGGDPSKPSSWAPAR